MSLTTKLVAKDLRVVFLDGEATVLKAVRTSSWYKANPYVPGYQRTRWTVLPPGTYDPHCASAVSAPTLVGLLNKLAKRGAAMVAMAEGLRSATSF